MAAAGDSGDDWVFGGDWGDTESDSDGETEREDLRGVTVREATEREIKEVYRGGDAEVLEILRGGRTFICRYDDSDIERNSSCLTEWVQAGRQQWFKPEWWSRWGNGVMPATVILFGEFSEQTKNYVDMLANTNITHVILPPEMEMIGDGMMRNAKYLEKVVFPKEIKKIGANAFFNCGDLKEIDLMSMGLKEIGHSAFYRCVALRSVRLPSSTTKIGGAAFFECDSLTDIDLRNTNLTEIEKDVFYGCVRLVNVVLPERITRIGHAAFKGCSSLVSVTIPGDVTEIGLDAFSECTSLERVKIPPGCLEIKSGGFVNCENLREIELRETKLEEIGTSAFHNCKSLVRVKLPSTVKKIGKWCFDGCERLEAIDLSHTQCIGDDSIGPRAFGHCKSLKKVIFPDKLQAIPKKCFVNCDELVEVVLPGELRKICEYAFYGCKKLETIVIPGGVTQLEAGAFQRCEKLKTIEFSERRRDDANDGFRIGNVEFENNVFLVGDFVFEKCTALEKIELPLKTQMLGNGTFKDCYNLEYIALPANIISLRLGDECFMGCAKASCVELPTILFEADGSVRRQVFRCFAGEGGAAVLLAYMIRRAAIAQHRILYAPSSVYQGGTRADWIRFYEEIIFPIVRAEMRTYYDHFMYGGVERTILLRSALIRYMKCRLFSHLNAGRLAIPEYTAFETGRHDRNAAYVMNIERIMRRLKMVDADGNPTYAIPEWFVERGILDRQLIWNMLDVNVTFLKMSGSRGGERLPPLAQGNYRQFMRDWLVVDDPERIRL
jgi:hypothetical protein